MEKIYHSSKRAKTCGEDLHVAIIYKVIVISDPVISNTNTDRCVAKYVWCVVTILKNDTL